MWVGPQRRGFGSRIPLHNPKRPAYWHCQTNKTPGVEMPNVDSSFCQTDHGALHLILPHQTFLPRASFSQHHSVNTCLLHSNLTLEQFNSARIIIATTT